MLRFEIIFERLSEFIGVTLSKEQWNIVLMGCGLPKTPYFWKIFSKLCLTKFGKYIFKLSFTEENLKHVIEYYEEEICISKELLELNKRKRELEQKMKDNGWD